VEARQVEVVNNAVATRVVGLRNWRKVNTGLSDVLGVVVLVDGVSVYGAGSATGAKTLTDLFAESGSDEGRSLVELQSGDQAIIAFEVGFSSQASDDYRGGSVEFDITLGVVGAMTGLPAECEGIEFDGEPIVGTEGSDNLRGTPGNDLIFGLEGSDLIRGRGGDDCLVGGAGSDSLRGEDGNDVLLGGEDSDSLKGGRGNDDLYGGGDRDSLRGERGDDRLYGGEGGDSLKGGSGDDVLIGGGGDDVARGQKGEDECEAEVVKTCEF
jgi:Ca2+-binding RTX toxin-like protein